MDAGRHTYRVTAEVAVNDPEESHDVRTTEVRARTSSEAADMGEHKLERPDDVFDAIAINVEKG